MALLGNFLLNLNSALTRIGVEMRARAPRSVATTANVTSTTTLLAGVSGLSFAAVAGKKYHIRLLANYQTAATTTGCRIGFTGAAAGTLVGSMRGSISSAAAATELAVPIVSTASILTTSGATPVNTPNYVEAEYVFTCTTSGTHQISFASETTTAATLLAGATLIFQEI